MSYIYRIENKKGESCYNVQWTDAIAKMLKDDCWNQCHLNRPFTEYDKGIFRKIKKQEVCGFINIRQLLRWFNSKDIRQMRKLDFNIVKVKVQTITAIGKHQVLAIR